MFVFFLPSRSDVTNAAADEITETVFEPRGGYMTAVKDISAQSNAHESDSPKVGPIPKIGSIARVLS